MTSKSLTLPVARELDCDVLVVGGGCAGLSAAVCAARHGADVLLAEQNGYLGGTATAGLVGPFMTSYDTKGETQLIRGFFDEFVRRMKARGGAIHPANATWGTSYTAYRTAGHRNLSAFSAEAFKKAAEEICGEAGVRLLYHLFFIHADVAGGAVRSAYFASKAGVIKVNAKVFVDCTGDGDLASAAGAPMVFGDGKGDVQATSLFFTVRGVDRAAMDAHMAASPTIEEKFYMREIAEEREKGNYPLYRPKIMLFEGVGGEWVVNMSQMDGVNGIDPAEATAAEITGRKQIDYILAFLRKYAAGCRDIQLVKSAAALGVRESRRIVSAYDMTAEDASESRRFDDAVFCCSNSLDIHRKGYVEYYARKSEAPYFVPYRALVPRETDALLVAGRCAGASREVMAAIRVMPPCFAMGQAAGTAAALSAAAGVEPRDLRVAELVAALKADGVYLPD